MVGLVYGSVCLSRWERWLAFGEPERAWVRQRRDRKPVPYGGGIGAHMDVGVSVLDSPL